MAGSVRDATRLMRFESQVLVHLDAAWRFARWLVGDQASAEDAVQNACLNALRGFEAHTGPSARAWFMAVVRNACIDLLRERARRGAEESFDEEMHGAERGVETPEAAVMRAEESRWIRAEVARLPEEYREVLVLRELEDLSYREIGEIVQVPIGTVMSRLSRARDLLAERVRARTRRESA